MLTEQDQAWKEYFVFPWHRIFVRSTEGTLRRIRFDSVMRRKLWNGEYEYREMTPQERSDLFDADAR